MACSFLIYGASGDLTRRKLIPALYQLHRKARLPRDTHIVGLSRTDMTDDDWRVMLAESTAQFARDGFDQNSWDEFAKLVHYRSTDITDADDFCRIDRAVAEIESSQNADRVYYLSTSPKLYETAVANLGYANMADESNGKRRIVIEKPFGTDLASSQQLNKSLHSVFREDQVYRIDHYLGKETVQNMFVLRFANSIFEPIWNRNYVDHIQITVAEEVTVGTRAGYYDTSGVLRDMIQNHLFQLLMITAMEAPAKYNAEYVRNEKVKVLQAVRPIGVEEICSQTVRGQYDGYLDEPDVPSGSQTATFAAMRLWIDNWRWQGVPFYLRSGKGMSCRTTQIVVQFRDPPHLLFGKDDRRNSLSNRLVIQIQPAEGIQLHFQTKVPDAGMQVRMTDLDFSFTREFQGSMPEAYERLLLDAAEGDASLFARSDEVELAWKIVDPIIDAWQTPNAPPLETYPTGLWGPEKCNEWMQSHDREWFDVCPILR
ncbi:MAG: glucose-6-phosphate dehydrogenase [Planctomycetales bacterium]|nr:glucose-6-phosphate dehydrogenase [Planctomycetales bacterium]